MIKVIRSSANLTAWYLEPTVISGDGSSKETPIVCSEDSTESSIKLYHNFVIKDTISASGTISHSSAPCMIGAEPNNSGYNGSPFDGLIKKVGVWSRGLTEEEIKKL